MFIIGRRTLVIILVVLFFLVGFFSVRYLNRPRIRLSGRYLTVNYRAKINPKKNYHLKLWDYKWPGPDGDTWYQPFIMKAIKDFENENPNIRVELTLLDFKDGPKEFAKALALGRAPDVYCSAYDIPEFNYQWQIPVGIFLKPQDLNIYYSSLRKLVTFDNYLLTLPRWSAPGIWIGNSELMEKAGLSAGEIQKNGWSWQDFTKLNERTEPICLGNYNYNGLLTQLLSYDGIEESNNSPGLVLDFLNYINGPLPQKSDLEVNMFHLFLSGKAMFLGGVRPIIYDFIRQKTIEYQTGWEPVLLPIPCEQSGKVIIPVENGVIGVYRNNRTGSDDQLAAAARLAYYISTYPQIVPWQKLKVVPAVPDIAQQWAKSSESTESSEQLIKWFAEANLCSLKLCPNYQTEVYPVLKGFLKGKITREDLERIILKNYK